MSRDILFRAWHKERKQMFPNVGFEDGDTGRTILIERVMLPPEEDDPFFNEYQYGWQEEEVELLQYTGLKDKNGLEIYEGDIVKFNNGRIGQMEVSSRLCAFIRVGDSDIYDEVMEHELEVIGNIWENPELLNTGK